jgi:diguanylate cyclase (GGDEF)-like protein
LDLDNFKQYNDLHGHQAGDAVLRDFASLIRKCTRDSDVAARYAGDEFVVLLPNTDQPEAVVVGERIRAAAEEFSFGSACDLRLRVTVSVGIAAFPADAEDESELIHAADKAMYASKALGNRVSVYSGIH